MKVLMLPSTEFLLTQTKRSVETQPIHEKTVGSPAVFFIERSEDWLFLKSPSHRSGFVYCLGQDYFRFVISMPQCSMKKRFSLVKRLSEVPMMGRRVVDICRLTRRKIPIQMRRGAFFFVPV